MKWEPHDVVGVILVVACATTIVAPIFEPGILEGEQLEVYEKVVMAGWTLLGAYLGYKAK